MGFGIFIFKPHLSLFCTLVLIRSSKPEFETGNQTAVCPDKGEHCLKEAALFSPLSSPSLKFGSNEKETQCCRLSSAPELGLLTPKAKIPF